MRADALGSLLNCTPARLRQAVWEFTAFAPCDVEINGKKQKQDPSRSVADLSLAPGDIVTLVNRRRQRLFSARKQATKRKRRQRERQASRESNASVTPGKAGSSVSASFSLSERDKSLSSGERERIFINPLEILRESRHFADISEEQYAAAAGPCSVCMDYVQAARDAVRAATLDGDVRKPGIYLAACFKRHTTANAADIKRREEKLRMRANDFRELVAFIAENRETGSAVALEAITRQKLAFTRSHGAAFVEKAEEAARKAAE